MLVGVCTVRQWLNNVMEEDAHNGKWKHRLKKLLCSDKLMVFMIIVSLFCDNAIFSMIEPILPDILHNLQDSEVGRSSHYSTAVINHHGRFGFLVAANPVSQICCSPFTSYAIKSFGHRRMLFIGTFILIGATVAFAFPVSYSYLIGCRIFQGIAKSLLIVTGCSFVAQAYRSDKQLRGKLISTLYFGMTIGLIVGPMWGLLYEFLGHAAPFLSFSVAMSLMLGVQLCAWTVAGEIQFKSTNDVVSASYWQTLTDPYIVATSAIIIADIIFFGNVVAFLSLRLIDLGERSAWKLGISLLPFLVAYAASIVAAPYVLRSSPRWLSVFLGLTLEGIICTLMSLAPNCQSLRLIVVFAGFPKAMVTVTVQPLFADLVDWRLPGRGYAHVYSIASTALSLGYILGFTVGGQIAYSLGSDWLFLLTGATVHCTSFVSLSLRKPAAAAATGPCAEYRPLR